MFVDYSQLQQIAVLEEQTGLWLKTQVTPLFGPLVLFSQTFPASGILHDGKLFVPLTQGQPTTGLGFSSLHSQNQELLRTPISSESEGGAMHPEDAKAGGNNLKLGWQILGHFGHIEPKLPTIKARDSVAEGYEAGLRRQSPQIGTIVKGIVDGDERVIQDLLPTPNTMEHLPVRTGEAYERHLYRGNSKSKRTSSGNLRESVVNDLMPTPTARDFKDGQAEHERDGVVQTDTVARAIFNSGEIDLIGTPRTSSANGSTPKQVANGAKKSRIEDQVLTTSWGKFEPAIRRWEQVIDRPAPAPTKPDGKDGAHRLSSAFTEWMMGLPEGWITDVGLTRNEELKACGNGVVPQQAELALRILLGGQVDVVEQGGVKLPTPTVSDTFTDNLASSQQKEGSMHSVTLPQAVRQVTDKIKEDRPR